MPENKSFYRWRPHPWHGLPVGRKPPALVNAYIEITPFDGIKYEIDKATGYLKVDRPQLTSALPPALYGFIPRTYCGKKVGKLSGKNRKGDGDPLDICVLSERPIGRSEVIVPARIIGGLRMIDRNEADDKIIAVVESDPYWAKIKSLKDLSPVLTQRLTHYFLTYKLIPGPGPGRKKQADLPRIDGAYGPQVARRVVLTAMEDYEADFGSLGSNP
jgi:inorganic pyrophosphatase